MEKIKELATDRIRAYPSDGKKLRVLAKKKGGRTSPADILHELLKPKDSLDRAIEKAKSKKDDN